MLDMLQDGTISSGAANTDILIVGTGFGGLAAAIKLREAGFAEVMLIEKASEVGGTWRDNSYPGCACDIPSHLYSLSFAPKADWTRMYPQQPELFGYVREIASKHDLRRLVRFDTVLLAAAWDEVACVWQVSTSTGPIKARVLISAMGGLHIPAYPNLPGIERFQGRVFHSAAWDHDYALTGKRVAVIGTGASAIQFVPQIAPRVARLDVYQRTPAWVIPKPDKPFSTLAKGVFRFGPARRAFRQFLFLVHELRVLAFLGNEKALDLANRMAVRHIHKYIKDPVLRAKLTPNYQVGCKRVMISNDYYPALARETVEVITDGIAEVRAHSVVDRTGAEREVDAIIFGTGFEVTTAYKHVRITGAGGRDLGALWDETGMAAYHGIAVSGFPNYFLLLGPHTALGHNSVVIMIEAQVRYIVDALTRLRAAGGLALDVRPEVQDGFLAALETRLRGTVWQDGGCESWYKDERGKVTTIWPGSAGAYKRAVRSADLRDYRVLTRV